MPSLSAPLLSLVLCPLAFVHAGQDFKDVGWIAGGMPNTSLAREASCGVLFLNKINSYVNLNWARRDCAPGSFRPISDEIATFGARRRTFDAFLKDGKD